MRVMNYYDLVKPKLKVAVLCEYSGIVRDAFIRAGHDALSYDILPTESTESYGKHICCDIMDIERDTWSRYDLIIAHPPCTHLSVSGARWFKDKKKDQKEAIEFFMYIWNLPVKKMCIENPVGIMSTHFRKPDQYIQPWQFGHGETKKTGLWLRGLPLLKPSNIVEGRENRIHMMSPGPNRGKERSRFYIGIAEAMAKQWGNIN